jgi:hypothetical protein
MDIYERDIQHFVSEDLVNKMVFIGGPGAFAQIG